MRLRSRLAAIRQVAGRAAGAKLPGGVVQPSLPFGEPGHARAFKRAAGQETPAAEQAAAAETIAPAPEATEAASGQ